MRMQDFLEDPAFWKMVIPGKEVRERFLNGWRYTKTDLAALLCHAEMPLLDRERYLEAILEDGADPVLGKQIKDYNQQRRRIFAMIAENSADHVYALTNQDKPCGQFSRLGEAEEAGRALGVGFEIKKLPLDRAGEGSGDEARRLFINRSIRGEDGLTYRTDGEIHCVGSIRYNERGEAVEYWLSLDAVPELTQEEATKQLHDPSLFQNAFVALPNPFEAGDIVKVKGTTYMPVGVKSEGYGVVETTPDEWEAACQQPDGEPLDYYDEIIDVELMDDQGNFIPCPVSPPDLERAMPEDAVTRDCLLAGRNLLFGRGSLGLLTMAQELYRKAKQVPGHKTPDYLGNLDSLSLEEEEN